MTRLAIRPDQGHALQEASEVLHELAAQYPHIRLIAKSELTGVTSELPLFVVAAWLSEMEEYEFEGESELSNE